MAENESNPSPAVTSMDDVRADLDRLGARDPVAARERALGRFGALLMVLGPIWVAVEYAISHSGQNSLQQRDAIIGALFGLSLCVAGTALFLRYSGGRVLRLWMARSALVTEQQNEALVAAVRAVREPEE